MCQGKLGSLHIGRGLLRYSPLNRVMKSMPVMLKLFTLVAVAVLCFAPIHPPANSQSVEKTPRARAPQRIFDEVAEAVGLKFQHYTGMTGKPFFPQIMASGAALFDFDNDGDLDVFLVQGSVLEPSDNPARTLFPWRESIAPRGKLFRNDLTIAKDGHRTLKFTDVTEQSGIVASGYGMGVIVGDVNNDGWPDLYLCY